VSRADATLPTGDLDRGEVLTLDQVQLVLGEQWEEFARDVAGGVVASTLAVLTAGGPRPVAVSAGAVADWLHGRLPAAVLPAAPAPYGEVEKVLAHLRVDVARWSAQERIDDGVAADLGYYLGEMQKVVEALENRVDEVTR
jgi:hypothetical protein